MDALWSDWESSFLLLEAARQGNLAFMSPIGNLVGVCEEPDDPRVKRRWPDAIIIETNNALRSWLENQTGGRRVYVPRSG